MIPKIILINGKKRSGKDHFARLLQEELYKQHKTSEIIAFADPIKDILAMTFNLSDEQLDKLKNDEAPIIIREDGYQKIVATFRSVLQNFGTDAMKKWFGESVWSNVLLERASNSHTDYVIVPDFRFLIEDIGGITIKIRNDEIEKNCTDNHRSENELNDYEFDYVIDNTGFPDLTEEVQEFVREIVNL